MAPVRTKHEVAGADGDPGMLLGPLQLGRADGVPGSSQSTPRARGRSSRTPRPTMLWEALATSPFNAPLLDTHSAP